MDREPDFMTRPRARAKPPAKQYAALPWRKVGGKIKILLVTTRTTKRWVIPKGWPMKDASPCDCAALEAFEEAGLTGKIAATPFGFYSYRKIRKAKRAIRCKVVVFQMKVTRQKTKWPEKAARQTEWFTPAEALRRVTEIGLKRLVRKFAQKARQPV
jgi:8-oxo-dGTP pyrophosphatase MutT (NUDIX family)